MKFKKLLAMTLIMSLILSSMSSTALANNQQQNDGICPHHTAHSAECGYAPGHTSVPCNLECEDTDSDGIIDHSPDCTYSPAQPDAPCQYVCPICQTAADTDSVQQITAWQWVDDDEYLVLDEESNIWSLELIGANEENPATPDTLQQMLPARLTVTLADGSEAILDITWNLDNYPPDGAYEGSYTLIAELPEGYALADDAKPLTVQVNLGEAMPMLSDEVLNQHIVTENVVDPAGTTVNLFDYWVNPTGEIPAADTTPKGDLLTKNHNHVRENGSQTGFSSMEDWNKGINQNKLLIFGDGVVHAGLWNKGAGENTDYGKQYAGMENIVKPVLENGYPVVNIDNAAQMLTGDKSERNWELIKDWKLSGECTGTGAYRPYEGADIQNLSPSLLANWTANDGNASLEYLFNPAYTHANKKTYTNVTGLFQMDTQGYYYYNMRKNFAEFDQSNNEFKLYDSPATLRSDGTNSVGNFFPFNTGSEVFTDEVDGKLTSDVACFANTMNHHLGMTVELGFRQPLGGTINMGTAGKQPMTFEFSGDDDVWIFVDDVLVLDLGGTHSELYGTINFETGDVHVGRSFQTQGIPEDPSDTASMVIDTNLKDQFKIAGKENTVSWNGNTFSSNSPHTLKMFYLERGNYDSSLALRFNLQPQLVHKIKKVDQDGNPVSGVSFDLYEAEEQADGSYTQKGSVLTSLITEADGTAEFWEKESLEKVERAENERPFNFADRYSNSNIQYYILKEINAPPGYRQLPIDIVLRYEPTSNMLIVENRYTTGAYASFTSHIAGNSNVTYGKVDMATGDIYPDETKTLTNAEKKNGLVIAIPMMYYQNQRQWWPLYGSNLEGLHSTKPTSSEVEAWRHASLTAALQQCANDNDNMPHWYLEWNNETQRLEGTLTDLPGRADRYKLMHTPGQPDDMQMAYAIIDRNALTQLGITGDTSADKYESLGHYIRSLANTEGIDIDTAVNKTAEKIHDVNGANGRGFSFLNVDQFSRDFRSLIYIPNEQRELRVWKIDNDGNRVNGAEFGLYNNPDCSGTPVASGTTANVDGLDGVLIFKPQVEAGTAGYAKMVWAKASETDRYYLKEISAPDGYDVNEVITPVVVGVYSIYADAGQNNDGVQVMAGVGKLTQTMAKFASDGDVDITLRDITAFGQMQPGGSFNLNGWQDIALKDTQNNVKRSMNLHYGKNALVDYGLHDEDGGANIFPFFMTDQGFIRARVQQNYAALNDPIYEGENNEAPKDNLEDLDITSLFSLLNIVVVTDSTKEQPQTGKLTISKTVTGTGAVETDYTKLFEFRVDLKDAEGNPLNNAYEYNFFGDDKSGFIKNGGTLKLHHDESVTISGLPNGAQYTITELNGDDYTTSATGDSGVIETGKNAVASFINSTERKYYGSLAISKTLQGDATDTDQLFTFTVTLGPAESPLEGVFNYNGSKKGTIESGGSVQLKGGESITIIGLPEDTTYTVTESDNDGYKVTQTGNTGSIKGNKTATAAFINSKSAPQFGSLAVSKTVAGDDSDPEKAFTFTVKLTDQNGMPLTGEYNLTGSAIEGVESPTDNTVQLTDGSLTVALKHGQSVIIANLPAGTKYTVEETDNEDYTVTADNETGSIAADEIIEAEFTNTKNKPDKPDTPDKPSKPKKHRLMISKTVAGTGADKNQEFTFTLTLTNSSGKPLTNAYTFSGSAQDGAEVPQKGTFKPDKNGEVEFTLKHGQSIIIDELPAGTQYSVKENDSQGYTVTEKDTAGKLDDGTTTASFINSKDDPTKPDDPSKPDDPNKPNDPGGSDNPNKPDDSELDDPNAPTGNIGLSNPHDKNKSGKTGSNSNSPRTGDSSHTMLWVTLCIAALAAIFAIAFVPAIRRKYQK